MAKAQAPHRKSPTREIIAIRDEITPFRCGGVKDGRRCGKLLAYVASISGRVEIVCPRCGTLNIYDPNGAKRGKHGGA